MAEDQPAEKKKSPVLLVGIVAAIMVLEGVAVFAIAKISGGPSGADAAELQGADGAGLPDYVELPLVNDTFPNTSSGRVWRWDIEVQILVRPKNEEIVAREMELKNAQVREAVGMIIRSAEDRHLNEPTMATIRRQIEAKMNELFGRTGDDLPLIEGVLIPRLTQAPGDF
jgi:hypothetical protein